MTAETHRQGAPVLYTAQEAAEILRVKKSWLERQAAARKIPFTVLGGSYRFTASHLAESVRLYEQIPSRPIEDKPTEARRRSQQPFGREGAHAALLRPRPRGGPTRAA